MCYTIYSEELDVSALPLPRLFTVNDYYTMAETGILARTDRVELIAGEVVEMSPIGSRHAACVKRLNHHLTAGLGTQVMLGVQDPVRLDDHSEPEPDVTVLRPQDDFYASAHPGPTDVLLLVEVSDSSLLFDREVKLPLYAANAIPEVWVVNLVKDLVEVHRAPRHGAYTESQQLRRGERLTLAASASFEVAVEAILG
jgi:Uma2 family endonuclease